MDLSAPDLLGIQIDKYHPLAYTADELTSLGVFDVPACVYNSSSDYYKAIICATLQPITDIIRQRRREMASFLRCMTRESGGAFRTSIQTLPNIHGNNQSEDYCRLAQFPKTVKEIEKSMDGQLFPVAREIRAFCNDVLRIPTFEDVCTKITGYTSAEENHRNNVDWQYAIHNMDYPRSGIPWHQLESTKRITDFSPIIPIARDFREQLEPYLLFASICAKGCIPSEYGSTNGGFIENAIHTAYRTYTESDFGFGSPIDPVPNDFEWNPEQPLTFITGHGSQGKSVYLRTLGMNALLHTSGFLPLATSAHMKPVRRVWPYIIGGDIYGAGSFETQERYKRQMCELATTEDILLIDQPSQGTEQETVTALTRTLVNDFLLETRIPAFVVTHDLALVREFADRPDVRCLRVAEPEHGETAFKMYSGQAENGYGMRHAAALGTDEESMKKLVAQRRARGEL